MWRDRYGGALFGRANIRPRHAAAAEVSVRPDLYRAILR
jgi:hypothetical protein